MNFAQHLLLRERQDSGLIDRTTAILTYPQYWNWRLGGAAASEVSYLGCHSHLWAPLQDDFSSLAKARGWAEKFPPLQPAGKAIGSLEGLTIHNGVHDSNAVFYFLPQPRL